MLFVLPQVGDDLVDLRDGVREEILESGAEVVQPRLAVRRAQDAVLKAFGSKLLFIASFQMLVRKLPR